MKMPKYGHKVNYNYMVEKKFKIIGDIGENTKENILKI